MDRDYLVEDYLGRLRTAAAALPADRRDELSSAVREHIEVALAEASSRDEVTVRNVLERLGTPEEIIAAEQSSAAVDAQGAPQPHVDDVSPRWGALEIAAVLFLVVGAVFLPFVGPLIGIVLVWLSSQWSTRDKSIATAIVIILLVIPFFGVFMAAGSGGAGAIGPVGLSPLPVQSLP